MNAASGGMRATFKMDGSNGKKNIFCRNQVQTADFVFDTFVARNAHCFCLQQCCQVFGERALSSKNVLIGK